MYELYKPLRNYLRPFSAWSGFGATFAYMQFLQFKRPLPAELLTFNLSLGVTKIRAGLHEWTVELLARELLLNSDFGKSGKPFATAEVAFRSMRMIHDLEGKSWGLHDNRPQDILLQLSRIAFQQFHWQVPITNSLLARYYRLYAHPPVASILQSELGISVDELFQLVMLLLEEAQHGPILAFAFMKEAHPSIIAPIEALRHRISASAKDLRDQARSLQAFDVNWAYSFNPLRACPLVHAGNRASTMCPAPPLLLRRLTDGLYFDLIRADARFGQAIGEAFEIYVGDVTKLLAGDALSITGETKYGRSEKRSVDWIIVDDSATLFVECKLARLDIASQTEISPTPPFAAALERLAGAIGQLYTSLGEALAGKYPHWQPDGRPIWPGVVTFYEWFAFGPWFYQTLESLLPAEFTKRGLDVTMLEIYPYFLCSIEEFEGLIIACKSAGIDTVLRKKNSVEHRRSITRGFLGEAFPGSLIAAAAAQERGMNGAVFAQTRLK